MLRAIRVTNFKAFGETQEIPIRPITLIYGPNSAGKSSILHALAYAHHASRTGELDVHKTELGGQSIDLGGFRQLIHRRNPDSALTLEFVVDTPNPSDATRSDGELEVAVTIALDHDDGVVRVKSYSIAKNGASFLSMRVFRDGAFTIVDSLDAEHPTFEGAWRAERESMGIDSTPTPAQVAALGECLMRVEAWRTGLLPIVHGTERRLRPVGGGGGKRMSADGPNASDTDPAVKAALFAIKQVVNKAADEVNTALRSLAYIGPLRDYPERALLFTQGSSRSARDAGPDTWEVLSSDKRARDAVNQWLGAAHMSTAYRLDAVLHADPAKLAPAVSERIVEHLSTVDIVAESEQEDDGGARRTGTRRSGGTYRRTGTSREKVSGGTTRAELRDPLSSSRIRDLVEGALSAASATSPTRIVELSLVDCARDTVVSMRDVGVGVSQVLPVLASAFAKDGRTIAIEQPELHLHPALQAELGDLFIETALGENRNRYILETHSEHLLLRVMRRLRETNDRTLPDGARAVSTQDIAVLFVERSETQSLVRVMPLTRRGELVKAWPGGFFEEGLREVF